MESLIIMVVLYLISTLFSKDKNKDKKPAKQQMPPFLEQKPSTTRIEPAREDVQRPLRKKVEAKSLEDFANEIFGQLNDKQQKVQPTVEPVMVEPKVDVPQAPSTTSTRPTLNVRSELGGNRTIIQRQKQKAKVTIPKSQNELVQAVIMAEVLGQPKAKQKRI